MTRTASSRPPAVGLRQRGFTLIELIVVLIIVGVLAAIAVPRFIAMGTDARVASVKAMAGTLWSAANMVHSACVISPSCDISVYAQGATIGGHSADLIWGWPNAGDNLGGSQIDIFVDSAGFTPSLPSIFETKFALAGAPDPANCAASYTEPSSGATPALPTVTWITSGC